MKRCSRIIRIVQREAKRGHIVFITFCLRTLIIAPPALALHAAEDWKTRGGISPEVLAHADSICIGHFQQSNGSFFQIENSGGKESSFLAAQFQVEESIKGRPGTLINVRIPITEQETMSGEALFPWSRRVLLALGRDKNAANEYDVESEDHSWMICPPEEERQFSEADPIAMIRHEVGIILRSPTTVDALPADLDRISLLFPKMLTDKQKAAEYLQSVNIEMLDRGIQTAVNLRLNDSSTLAALKALTNSSSRFVSFRALGAYVELGNLSGTQSYEEVMKFIGSGVISDQDKGYFDVLLMKVVDKAKKTGDLDALESLMTTQSDFIASDAGGVLQNSAPSPKLLIVFGNMLNSGTNRSVQKRGILGIFKLSMRLGLQPHKDIPELPSKDFDKRPDYWVKVWTEWLAANRDKLIKMMEKRGFAVSSG